MEEAEDSGVRRWASSSGRGVFLTAPGTRWRGRRIRGNGCHCGDECGLPNPKMDAAGAERDNAVANGLQSEQERRGGE
ncbi:hypothetical protein E2562_034009 [Oryza meyeriana var. granulata]|uniref:Uncharacterized protein n=1 Tax=Oryza meyeriana var. granulata TaxID=110450 RepID=A0A6G1ES97_9ORYZ|nr:hypothetical protein E2562_034009 [Oryza meyeriana var. granulata]